MAVERKLGLDTAILTFYQICDILYIERMREEDKFFSYLQIQSLVPLEGIMKLIKVNEWKIGDLIYKKYFKRLCPDENCGELVRLEIIGVLRHLFDITDDIYEAMKL